MSQYLEGLNGTYSALQTSAQDGARSRAGRAYATGDRDGVRSALGGAGLVGDAMAFDNSMLTRDANAAAAATTAEDREIEAQGRRRATVIAAARGLRNLPTPEERWTAFNSRAVPMLREAGVGDDVIGQMTPDMMDDRTLDSVIAQYGGEVERGTPMSVGNGRVIRPDPYTGAVEEISPAQAPPAPAHYRWAADGTLEPIPGGAADPQQAGSLAASRRAPPRGRSGSRGGGSSSGSGARSRSFDAGSIQWD